jgi:hypothetical protein
LVPEGKLRSNIGEAEFVDSLIMIPREKNASVPILVIPDAWKNEESHCWGVRKNALDLAIARPVNSSTPLQTAATNHSESDWEEITGMTVEMKGLFVALLKEIDPRWNVSVNSLVIQRRYDSSKVLTPFFFFLVVPSFFLCFSFRLHLI